MTRLVLFDIDGTLLLTGGAGERAFDRVCETEFGVVNGTAQLNFAGRTDTSIVRDFFKNHGITLSRENFARFFDRYVFWLDHLMGEFIGRVLPGAETMIADLRRMPQPPVIGLLTGNIRLGAQIKLRHYGLWECFELGAFGDDHEDRNQLAVLAQERGSQRLGRPLRGEEIVVVGDTALDIACGRKIGARVLAVATGRFGVEELKRHQPDWTVATLEEVRVADVMGNGTVK